MKKIKILLQMLPYLFFAIALWLGHQMLQKISYQDFSTEIGRWQIWQILGAFALTGLNFVILAVYDLIGFWQVKQKVPFRKIFSISFTAFSLSNIVGHSLFSGTAVRLKEYAKLGVSIADITKISINNTITFWLGFLFLTGIGLPLFPADTIGLGIGSWGADALALFLLALLGCYLFCTLKWPLQQLSFGKIGIVIPSFRSGVLSIMVATLDNIVFALILYVLLPPALAIGFWHFLILFMISILAGLLSQIPGGLGVLDGVLLHLLLPYGASHEVLFSIVFFRIIYYLIPLFITFILQLVRERAILLKKILRTSKSGHQFVSPIVPQVLSMFVFGAGVILLLSGMTPALQDRMIPLYKILPPSIIELANISNSVMALTLLLLANQIWKRHHIAFQLVQRLLILGAVISLLKGLDWEEAGILLVIWIILRPFEKVFYRQAPIWQQGSISIFDLTATATIIAGIIVGLFAYADIPYTHDLWLRFQPSGDAERFLRNVGLVVILLLLLSVWRLRHGPNLKITPASDAEIQKVLPIIQRSCDTGAQLALLGDKSFKLSADAKAFLMYGAAGNTLVVLGDIYGEKSSGQQLLGVFLDEADQRGVNVIFYQCTENFLPRVLENGMQTFKIGEEAIIDLQAFSLEGPNRKKLRNAYARAQREGLEFAIIPASGITPDLLAQLKIISDKWLQEKNVKEKGFSLGNFNEKYLAHFDFAVIKKIDDHKIVGFANLFYGNGVELSIDLMRYDPELAPQTSMDFLFTSLFFWGKERGFQHFSLGVAPLSGLTSRPRSPFWYKIANLAFDFGEYFYNFQGLREYKEKYHPDWRSRFIAYDGATSIFKSTTDLALLIGGGAKGLLGLKK